MSHLVNLWIPQKSISVYKDRFMSIKTKRLFWAAYFIYQLVDKEQWQRTSVKAVKKLKLGFTSRSLLSMIAIIKLLIKFKLLNTSRQDKGFRAVFDDNQGWTYNRQLLLQDLERLRSINH